MVRLSFEMAPKELPKEEPQSTGAEFEVQESVPEAQVEKPQEYQPVFDSPEKRECLKERTAQLIEEIKTRGADAVVFMDRSARPLSWALREAWDTERDGEMPRIKFVNIGREKGPVLNWGGMEPHRDEFESVEEWQQATKEFWSKVNPEEYVQKFNQDRRHPASESETLMTVDDWSESGFSSDTARDFLRRHFPNDHVEQHQFFRSSDRKLFNKRNFRGLYLPWHEDKSYTLMSAKENPTSLTAAAEKDSSRRVKGLQLREEIKRIFAESKLDQAFEK